MKQKLLKLKALLVVLMMAVGFGQAMADEVSMSSFSSVSADMNDYISYVAAKGTAATAPAVNSNEIRVYQNGGTFTVSSKNGAKINSVTLGSSMATTVTYSVDGGSASSNQGISAGGTVTVDGLDCSTVLFTCVGTTKNTRLYVNSLSVTYTFGSVITPTTTTIDATGITNTDIYTSTEAGSLAATVSVKDGDPIDGATVTWSGDKDNVATIDASTGAVTLVGAGTVTFTASYAGVQDQYTSSSDTYVLTVTDSAPYTGGDVTFDATADMGTSPLEKNGVTFTCSNGVLNNGSEYRLYKNSITTFSLPDDIISQGFVIQKVEFTGTGSNPASGFAEQEGWTTDGYNGTWTGAATSVSFTASGAQVRATQIVVTVGIPSILVSLTVSGTPTKTTYEAGEALNPAGLVVTGTFDDQSVAEITDGITWSFDPETLTAGLTSCNVTATVGNVTSEAFEVTGLTVTTPKTLTGITVTGTPAEFWKGDTFNHDGMTVTANYDDETSADVTDEAEFSTPDMSVAGEQTVTVTYKEQIDSYTIDVKTIANTEETAYTTAQAIELIQAGKDLSTEVYVKGVVSSVDNFNDKYYSITYWLDNNTFEVYSGKGIAGANFESIDDIEVGAQVVVKGVIKLYGTTYEFDKNNELVSYQAPVAQTANMRITNAGWATFWAPFAVDIPAGVKAYTGEMRDGWIFMNELTNGIIPGNTGVVVELVEGEPFETELSPMSPQPNEAAVESCYTGNTTGTTMAMEVGDYLLQKQNDVVGWYKVEGEGFTLARNRCYLAKGSVPEPNQSRTFFGFAPDDATGINSIATEAKTKADGKYMVNGQIVVVKAGKAYYMNGTEVK